MFSIRSLLLLAFLTFPFVDRVEAWMGVVPILRFYRPSRMVLSSASEDIDTQEQHLLDIARRLKLEVIDFDEVVYGYESKDSKYGLEVLHPAIRVNPEDGLGLTLTEIAGSSDGRGLVLVSKVSGNAAQADPPIQVGDVLTGVASADNLVRECLTGLNYDLTVEAIYKAKQEALQSGAGSVSFEINRLVERAKIRVEVVEADGSFVETIEALAGENLRRLLLRKGTKLYDPKTKRFDMPYSAGDCGGDGLCGTCLVAILEGSENLNDPDYDEQLITKGRPESWRASCRAIVGANNKAGTIRIVLRPQSGFEDELDHGVQTLKMDGHFQPPHTH